LRVFEASGGGLKGVKEMIGHTALAMANRYSPLTNRHKQIRQDEFAKYYRDGMCYYEVRYKFKVQKAEKKRVCDNY
jgi:hypothetical protein